MKRFVLLFVVIGLIGSTQAALDVFNYDFDSLTVGAIDGQDGWSATSGDVIDLGSGDLALQVPNANYPKRVSSVVLTEEMVSYQADFRYFTGASNITARLYLTGSGTTTPFLGLNGGQIEVRPLSSASGLSPAVKTDAPSTFDTGDWVTLRMTFDSVNETATVSYMNLTDGESVFTNLVDFTNFDIGLGNVGELSSYLTSFTDIKLRTDGNNGTRAIDNIAVSVPEPATMVLLGLGSLLLRRRK